MAGEGEELGMSSRGSQAYETTAAEHPKETKIISRFPENTKAAWQGSGYSRN